MGLRRWAISAAGAAGLAALARRRMARGGAPSDAHGEIPGALPPAANPLVEGGDPAGAIDAARERLRREADARGGEAGSA